MAAGPFPAGDREPAYLEVWRRGELAARVEAALAELRECRTCPRDCGVDRLAGEKAVCRVGRHAVVASAFPHHGEEGCLRGWRGSGTIFFSGCNLRCAFCQNWDISQRLPGEECTADDLAGLMLALQAQGCHNLNLVTPEHVAPQVVEAIARAVPRGLRLPIVYNTGGYDGLSSLRLMEGLVDIYMPDFKFWEPATARRLARAAGYPERAREALAEMHRQVGVLQMGPDGLARRGVLVRHLVLPGLVAESAAIFAWLAGALSPDTYLNIMAQYRPNHLVPGAERYRDVDRRPMPEEIDAAYEAARAVGLWRFAERG
jgi:putative pyruvate formate lyase activating enzyme